MLYSIYCTYIYGDIGGETMFPQTVFIYHAVWILSLVNSFRSGCGCGYIAGGLNDSSLMYLAWYCGLIVPTNLSELSDCKRL